MIQATRQIKIERKLTLGEARVAGGMPTIRGYGAVFYNEQDEGTEFQLFDGYYERIMPGAFDGQLGADVRALYNHDPNIVLGRTTAGTLRLSVDSVGLVYEIDPPDTPQVRALCESIKRGDVSGSSFQFTPVSTTYDRGDDGEIYISRNKVVLHEVGPCTFPAYPSTSANLRSGESATFREIEEEVKRYFTSEVKIPRDVVQSRAAVVRISV